MTRAAIVFRADASHAIGLGHVARITALIEEVAASEALEPIAMLGGDDGVAAWARREGIAAEVGAWTADDLLAVVAQSRARAVVLDGPALVSTLGEALGATTALIVIDDAGDCSLAVHAVVNHNFHAPALAGGYPHAAHCLLGRRYLMLRRAIRRHGHGACRGLPSGGARLRVAVTFGGSDPIGATARTLRALPRDRALDVVAIAGPGFRDAPALLAAAAVAQSAGHSVEIVRSPSDPGALFASCHAAICSAGGTLGELAYLGCPALAFAIVADQLAPARALADASLIASGARWSDVDDDTLSAAIARFVNDNELRRDVRDRALATADGHGPRRIIDEALA